MEHYLKNGRCLTVRQGRPSDAEHYVSYVETVAGESDFLTFGPGEYGPAEGQRRSIEELTDPANGLFLLAEQDGRIVGNLTFRLGKRSRTAHVGEFGITVRREWWGQGVGGLLIGELIKWCRQGGRVRKINLRTRADNRRGLELYRRLGFAEEGLLCRDLYHDGVFYDSVMMGLCIDLDPGLADSEEGIAPRCGK